MSRDDSSDSGSGDQVTLGGRVLPPDPARGPLHVGPLEDPDRYELQDDGTRGGEGRTWRAVYRGGLNNPLVGAVKMLFPPEGAATTWPTEADMRRWHDNAALLRHLAQPHVVQLHDIFGGGLPHPKGAAGPGRPVAYLLMEWVDGPTLATYARGTPVTRATLAERLGYIDDVATAVASLHSSTRSAGNPALHRDLTPANCIVHATRGIVLIDISGMRLVDDGFDPLGRHTPAYTAPEVLRAPHEPRRPSSDLYAVGAIAVWCLTGHDPGAGAELRPELEQRLVEVLAQAGAAAPAEAARHLLGLLHPLPEQRPTDIVAWSRELATLAAPGGTAVGSAASGRATTGSASRASGLRRPLMVGAAGVLAVGLAAAGTVFAHLRDESSPGSAGSLKAARTPAPSSAPTQTPTSTFASTSTSDTREPERDASAGFSPIDFFSTAGRITSPSSGDTVRDCEFITGTAAPLPPGQTLVVSQHNLGGGDTIRFLQVTRGFDQPETLATWRTSHYFNDAAVGQDMLLELIRMPLTPALVKADDDQRYDISSALAGKGAVLAAVTVVHVNEHNPDYPC